jgi:predicted AAA+ superfamily ATPase
MIKRDLVKFIKEDAKKAPVLAILGPRQSGKTTLARATFPQYTYVSLEDLDMRRFALDDPRGFLARYTQDKGLILDEMQHAPELLSYIQTFVDQAYKPGFFVLTGSQNFLLHQAVTQTLAGRISLHTLLPLSVHELKAADLLPSDANALLYQGCYPVIYARKEEPRKWYADYVRTYLERDVRTITQVTDLSLFKKFLQLCAGRIGQLLNITSLANDCGISVGTVHAWLSVLEASYIIFLLQPHYKNFSKRLIKSPKLYFYDTGLACSLLGIESEKELETHYLRGGLFESMVIADLFKAFYNADRIPRLYFWRDKTGHEVDLIIEKGKTLYPIEIKAGMTINPSFFDGLEFWNTLSEADPSNGFIVCGGEDVQQRTRGNVVCWPRIDSIINKI